MPLQTLPQARAAFEIHNSPLTENAVIGFEYGYNIQEPSRLVIWEAQYGDFINGAQVMIDEFIVSARGKWGLRPSLVLLLPHAHEGQGPDHASARPERFLQLAADINIRVANCTTAAQFFHLLRRQAALLTVDPLPLVVLTPKSLLRHPLVPSTPRELAEGRFQQGHPRRRSGAAAPTTIRRAAVLQRQGLRRSDQRRAAGGPAGRRHLPGRAALSGAEARAARGHRAVPERSSEIVWVQEEPENMGVWDFIRPCAVRRRGGRPGHPRRPAAQRQPRRRARPRGTRSISRCSSSRPTARARPAPAPLRLRATRRSGTVTG